MVDEATSEAAQEVDEALIKGITRPHKNLIFMYFLQALAGVFLFPFIFVPLFFKYHTLRYAFDDDGISARWGILFRREIYLTYRRIQDIHVSRNLFERWLGIAKVEIQTASGSSSAELSLEGMSEYEAVRDFLYGRMRGTAPGAPKTGVTGKDGGVSAAGAGQSEVVALLREIKGELEGARKALEGREA